MFTHRSAVSLVLALLSLASLAGCFGKPMKIKAADAAVAGKQSDGGGTGGEAGPSDGPGPVADSKIATDGPTSNGGSGVDSGTGGNSGTVDSSVAGSGGSSTGGSSVADSGVGGGGGGAGGVTASDASANGGSNAGGSSGAGSGGSTGGGVAGSSGTGPDAAPDVPPDVPVVDAPGTCSADKECPSETPLCLGNRCARCAGDSDCAGRAGPACAASGSCVACTSDKQCTGAAKTCDTTTNQCVGCVTRSDCAVACQTCTSGVCAAVKGQDDLGFCDGTCDSTGACKKKQGQACLKTADCAGGIPCVDGYCCRSACTGSCQACDVANSLGSCTTLSNGTAPRAGHPPCDGSGMCMGTCNGLSASCTYPGAETTCDSATCTNGTAKTPTCNGSGACSGEKSTPCGTFACGVSACLSTCSANSQCASGAACVGGTCAACLAGQTACPGQCVNLQTNNAHCGTCSTACGATEQCKGGACLLADGQSCTNSSDCAAGTCSWFYPDADSDGYPVSTSSMGWCNVSTARALHYIPARADGKWDCYDNADTVHPDQTDYFVSECPGYGWDYNCSGTIEKRSEADVGDTCVVDASSGTGCSIVSASGVPTASCGVQYTLPTMCSGPAPGVCNWMGSYLSSGYVACH